MPKKNYKGEIIFKDYPEFKPNLTPKEIFELGSFGGTYYRPIYSKITKKHYKNVHKKYKILKGIPDNKLTNKWKNYDKNINKYKVKVGTTLKFWELKNWITKYNPYGQCDWYVNFYMGKRTPDDRRQINRWLKTAGPNSRFRLRLINLLIKNKKKYNDYSISPKIRQTLQHWGYKLTLKDFNKQIKKNNNKLS